MKRMLFGAAMIMLGSTTVQAQDLKPYAGVGVGAFGIEYSGPGLSQKNTVFGGYGKVGVDINDYFGVELRGGSIGTGSTNYPAGAVKLTTDYFLSYLAKFQYQVAQNFHVYGLLGATTAKLKATAPAALGISLSPASTKTGLSYGFGGEYALNDQVSLGGEWMQYLTDVSVGSNQKVRMWGAVGTATLHF